MKISRWQELYENSESRKLKRLNWIPIPNNHDGEKYAEMMEEEHGLIIFACFVLMLQVASKCKPRGSLIRDDGTTYNSIGLSRKTRGKKEWFDIAIPFLLKIGWIEISGESPDVPGESPGVSRHAGVEGKGRGSVKTKTFRKKQLIAIAEVSRSIPADF